MFQGIYPVKFSLNGPNIKICDGWTEGQAVEETHRRTDRQTEEQRALLLQIRILKPYVIKLNMNTWEKDSSILWKPDWTVLDSAPIIPFISACCCCCCIAKLLSCCGKNQNLATAVVLIY